MSKVCFEEKFAESEEKLVEEGGNKENEEVGEKLLSPLAQELARRLKEERKNKK